MTINFWNKGKKINKNMNWNTDTNVFLIIIILASFLFFLLLFFPLFLNDLFGIDPPDGQAHTSWGLKMSNYDNSCLFRLPTQLQHTFCNHRGLENPRRPDAPWTVEASLNILLRNRDAQPRGAEKSVFRAPSFERIWPNSSNWKKLHKRFSTLGLNASELKRTST